jgi:iron transport multicopper oxidase
VAVVAWYGFSAPVDSTSAGALSAGLIDNDSGDVNSAQKGPQETVISPTSDARSH